MIVSPFFICTSFCCMDIYHSIIRWVFVWLPAWWRTNHVHSFGCHNTMNRWISIILHKKYCMNIIMYGNPNTVNIGKLQLKKSLDWLEKTWTRAHQLAVTFPIVSNVGPIIIFPMLHYFIWYWTTISIDIFSSSIFIVWKKK